MANHAKHVRADDSLDVEVHDSYTESAAVASESAGSELSAPQSGVHALSDASADEERDGELSAAEFDESFGEDGDFDRDRNFENPDAPVAGFNSAFAYHSKKQPASHVHRKHSRRMRIVLLVSAALLCVLLAALGYFTVLLFNEVGDAAKQQVSATTPNSDVAALGASGGTANDAGTSDRTPKKASVPVLVDLVGLSKDEALAKLGEGASVASETDIKEKVETGEGSEKKEEEKVVGKSVSVSLDKGAVDARGTGSSVYLTLDESGVVTMVGYSASITNLGYGNVSFSDAVGEHVIEKSLAEAGVPVELGYAVLPEDSSQYRSYTADGSKVSEEKYTFSGTATIDGKEFKWTARLSYDYSAANVSDKLGDTIKLIYIYVSHV